MSSLARAAASASDLGLPASAMAVAAVPLMGLFCASPAPVCCPQLTLVSADVPMFLGVWNCIGSLPRVGILSWSLVTLEDEFSDVCAELVAFRREEGKEEVYLTCHRDSWLSYPGAADEIMDIGRDRLRLAGCGGLVDGRHCCLELGVFGVQECVRGNFFRPRINTQDAFFGKIKLGSRCSRVWLRSGVQLGTELGRGKYTPGSTSPLTTPTSDRGQVVFQSERMNGFSCAHKKYRSIDFARSCRRISTSSGTVQRPMSCTRHQCLPNP